LNEFALTVDEVAKAFKISKHTVYELIKRGELKAFKVGNKMRIEEKELERFKDSQRTSHGNETCSSTSPPLSLHVSGSHDFLVEHLIKYVSKQSGLMNIHPTYIGSLEGLMMLYRGSADLAAIHLLDPASQEYNLPFIQQLFVHEPITMMRLAAREQGFIVQRGNPKNIHCFQDLTRKDVTFINRQKGSGTRFLFDSFLAKEHLTPSHINGYENEEWNHLNIALAVSRGFADVAFGIQSAARQLELDFIPIAKEQFDLVFRWTPQNKDALEHLMNILQFTTFKEEVLTLEGYDASQLGMIIYEHQ
jgi:putative molybdopterin biosynthesis protein